MPPPLIGVGEDGQSNVTMLASPVSMESVCQNAELKERNYMGFPDSSSLDSYSDSSLSSDRRSSLNIKATELRLGLPGSQSPERDANLALINSTLLDEKPLFPLHPSKDGYYSSQKAICSGNKRGFSDTMNGLSEGKFLSSGDANVVLSPRPTSNTGLKCGSVLENLGTQTNKAKEMMTLRCSKEITRAGKEVHTGNPTGNNKSGNPAPKAQVVGWPPIRSFRKNSLAATSKNAEEVNGKTGSVALFVKVRMDGAPYLRKVDLQNYAAYHELSSALEKMFSCFIAGQYGSHGNGKEMLTESKLKDPLGGSEYVLTYEDKDGDWMLVGDVPWEMFADTCRRLRIMKSSEAIGLAPRAGQKNKNHV